MQAWVWITFGAALAQTVRFMLQRHLAGTGLSAAGATYARFVYAVPLVAVVLWAYSGVSGQPVALPQSSRFWAFALAGGLAQILATVAVVALFSMRNFAVGITLKKTETLQTALMGFVLLGELISAVGLAGIAVGFLAVLLLTDRSKTLLVFGLDRSAGLGLLSGALFGISGVAYRGASLSLESGDTALRAALTLLCVTAVQTLAMTAWFGLRDRAQIAKVLRAWRVAGLVGITSMIGSLCWFSAFTLQQAAYVNAIGQVELVLSLLAATLFYGERITPRELVGMALLVISILVIVLAI